MEILHQELKRIAKNEIDSANYEGNLTLEEFYETPRFKADTDMVTNDINEKYNPEYEEQNPGKSRVVIRDVSKHEINHHSYKTCIGCPQTLEKHVEFFYDPMSEVLLGEGFSHEDIKYATNALEDTLLHEDLNKNEYSNLEGIKYFFEEVGNSEKGKKFTKFYEAHVKLNMFLWGNKQQKKYLQKFFTHDEKIKEVINNFLDKLDINELKGTINSYTRSKNGKERIDKEIKIKDRNKIKHYFLNESNWKNISKVYAEEFSKLMEPSYALPIFNHSGKGTKGRENEIPVEEGNVFDKRMKNKEFRKSRVRKSHNEGKEAPNWISNYEAMDLLYEHLAQKLNIKAKTYTEEEQMPVAWYGEREFNPEKDNLKHIKFGFNENGKFQLKKKRFHKDIPIQIKTRPMGFPRMRFGILDTSGSMKWDVYNGNNIGNTKIIEWGDKSKYHYALLGWYGFLEYLKQNHLLVQNTVDIANFSDETNVGKGLIEAKKVALHPQFGVTKLEKDEIKYFFEGRDNLIFTISDGEIDNWSSIKNDFIRNAKNHQYFHLQIGSENSTTSDLRNSGLYVEYVMGDEDLARKTIDLTDKLFRK